MAIEKHNNIYRSRISVLIILFILFVVLLTFVPNYKHGNLYTLAIPLSIVSFVFLILASIKYKIANDKLLIKVLFITMDSIPIDQISSIRRSYNPLSSPASSLKRLAVYRQKRREELIALISPIREKEFIEELLKKNSSIKVDVKSDDGKWNPLNYDI
ncbi:MAG: PH domain-containing protein [Bacteroidales bacterium]|nr:PH domain-containing protein [Bacteroidales bacterium]